MLVYPINVLRNAARKGAGTGLHIVADMENIFSRNFANLSRPLANKMLRIDEPKSVLVYRRFESEANVSIPRDIDELADLLQTKMAYQFHWSYYKAGHFIAKLDSWLNYSRTSDVLAVQDISYSRGSWEPQFIMRADDPYHFEDVPTRIKDHQVLAHELCRAGYKFRVLTHVFNVHKGVKRKKTIMEELIQRTNSKKSSEFKRQFTGYLDEKYPQTKFKCPRI
ncbi:Protein F01D4.9 [Aphelenchoides avenae]|nr:Protein F01D4.9 [Aphelenchus avenae]